MEEPGGEGGERDSSKRTLNGAPTKIALLPAHSVALSLETTPS